MAALSSEEVCALEDGLAALREGGMGGERTKTTWPARVGRRRGSEKCSLSS